jgi:phosphatidylglycerophosphate synthase
MLSGVLAHAYERSKGKAGEGKRPAAKGLFAAANSASNGEDAFDKWLRVTCNEPLLRLVPAWVSPNAITAVNHAMCMATVWLAAWSFEAEADRPALALLVRVVCAVLAFANMCGDCLDGMQARKTGQSSKLGELLDHALDAGNIPMLGGSISLAMHGDPYSFCVGTVAACVLYNAQLVVYRYERVMIVPPVSGPIAQLGVSVAHVGTGAVLFVLGRAHPALWYLYLAFTVGQMLGNAQNILVFWRQLLFAYESSLLLPNLVFVLFFVPHSLLLVAGRVSGIGFVFAVTAISIRLSGRFLLSTLLFFKNPTRFPVTKLPYCSWTVLAVLIIYFAALQAPAWVAVLNASFVASLYALFLADILSHAKYL